MVITCLLSASCLQWVSGSMSPGASKRVAALWVNMREEPVVYIKGVPFVLREEVSEEEDGRGGHAGMAPGKGRARGREGGFRRRERIGRGEGMLCA